MMLPDPKWLDEPRPREWIMKRREQLETAINDEIAARWPKHCRLTHESLVESVCEKHLNVFWSHTVLASFGVPSLVVAITQYRGAVDES